MDTAYFCLTCDVPIIGDLCERCGRPVTTPRIPFGLSPVFEEELKMLGEVTGDPVDEFESLELWTLNRYYYYKGKKIFKVVGGNMIEDPKIEWVKEKKRVLSKLEKNERLDEKEYCHRIKEANRFALGTLEEKSIRFIQDVAEKFRKEVVYKAVSFSGGKDSMVLSHLVRKAFGSNRVLHIFIDTTLENPETLDFIKRFADEEKIFLLKVEPQQSFTTLVDKALLPSRIHRWCLTALKIAPLEKLMRQILEHGDKILLFEGARHEESLERQKYEEVELKSKIAFQIIARPILSWSTLEEWLYILGEGMTFNKSYRYGLRRVGCTLCPHNSLWSEFVLKSHYPSLIEKHLRLLYDYAKPQKLEKSMKDYIANGQWKTRAGGSAQHKYSSLSEIPNWEGDYKYIRIALTKAIDMPIFGEYIKPLSKKYGLKSFESQIGTKTILILSKEQEMVCKIVLEGESLCVWWFVDENKMYHQFHGFEKTTDKISILCILRRMRNKVRFSCNHGRCRKSRI